MMDRNASGRLERDAQGAQAEWLGAMQSLAEQIQKQQQYSQQMTQELMNTYSQLLNTPGSYLSGQAEQSNRPSSRRPSSGWSRPSNNGTPSSSKPNSSSSPSSR
jgi:signal transduction histidine kinase